MRSLEGPMNVATRTTNCLNVFAKTQTLLVLQRIRAAAGAVIPVEVRERLRFLPMFALRQAFLAFR